MSMLMKKATVVENSQSKDVLLIHASSQSLDDLSEFLEGYGYHLLTNANDVFQKEICECAVVTEQVGGDIITLCLLDIALDDFENLETFIKGLDNGYALVQTTKQTFTVDEIVSWLNNIKVEDSYDPMDGVQYWLAKNINHEENGLAAFTIRQKLRG